MEVFLIMGIQLLSSRAVMGEFHRLGHPAFLVDYQRGNDSLL